MTRPLRIEIAGKEARKEVFDMEAFGKVREDTSDPADIVSLPDAVLLAEGLYVRGSQTAISFRGVDCLTRLRAMNIEQVAGMIAGTTA
jgi:hypothetical protein